MGSGSMNSTQRSVISAGQGTSNRELMPKAYLRYISEGLGGVLTSNCRPVLTRTEKGQNIVTARNEEVAFWRENGVAPEAVRVPPPVLVQGIATGAPHNVSALATGDGVVAAGYRDGSIRLWSLEAPHALLATFQGHTSPVSVLEFSLSGHLLVSGGMDTTVTVWDVIGQQGLFRLRGHKGPITSLALVYDTKPSRKRQRGTAIDGSVVKFVVSGSKDSLVKIWSLTMQSCVQTLVQPGGDVTSLIVSAAMDRLYVAASDARLHLFSLTVDDTCVAEAIGCLLTSSGKGRLTDLIFLPVFDCGDGVPGPIEEVTPNGLIVQRSEGETQWLAVDSPMFLLGVMRNGRTLEVFRKLTAAEGAKQEKKLQRRQKEKINKKRKKATGDLEGVLADDIVLDLKNLDNDHVDVQKDKVSLEMVSLRFLHVKEKLYSLIAPLSGPATDVLVSGMNGSLTRLNLDVGALMHADWESAGNQVSSMSCGHQSLPRALTTALDDSAIASVEDGFLRFWTRESVRWTHSVPLKKHVPLSVAYVLKGSHVVCGTKSGCLLLVDTRSMNVVETVDAHAAGIHCIRLDAGGTGFYTASADKSMKHWMLTYTEVDGLKQLSFAEGSTFDLVDQALTLAVTPNGKYVCAGLLDNTCYVYYSDSRKLFLTLYGHKLPCTCIDVASDSTILVSGSADTTLKIWGLDFGNIQRTWHAHDQPITAVRFLPGTHYVASGCQGGVVKLWDADRRDLITTLLGHSGPVAGISYTADADRLFTLGAQDRAIRVWKRTDEQLFPEDERAREMEEQMEQEALENMPAANHDAMSCTRASRMTMASIRSTEELLSAIDLVDEAWQAEKVYQEMKVKYESMKLHSLSAVLMPSEVPVAPKSKVELLDMTPHEYLWKALQMPTSHLYEIVLAVPYSYARKLLQFLASYLEAMHNCQDDVWIPVELCSRLVLLLVQSNMKILAQAESEKVLLLRIRRVLTDLVARQERLHLYNRGALTHLVKSTEQERVTWI